MKVKLKPSSPTNVKGYIRKSKQRDFTSLHTRGGPQKRNYLLGAVPFWYGLPLLGEHSRDPSVAVCQLALLWEVLFSFSEFFLKTVSMHFAQFMMGDLRAHLLTPHCMFSSFWPKPAWSLRPTLPIHQVLPPATFFVSPDESSPQREVFCPWGRGETKNSRSTKRHQNWVQKLFWAVEKTS